MSALLLLLVFAAHDVRAAPSEAGLKGAVVLQLIHFVTWPDPPATGSCRVAVVQGGRVRNAILERASGKKVDGFPISIVDGFDPLFMPEVVFLGDAATYSDFLPRLEGRPTLTISDVGGFAKGGGMIELVRDGTRIRLDINRGAVERAGLQISSTLLRLARKIYD